MHPEIQQWVLRVKKEYPEYFRAKKVFEVGSLDINGSIRGFFEECTYTGLDVGEGPGVDIVCPIHQYIKPGAFDVVISTEMLEHDKYWEQSLGAMYSNLKKGGILILTCAAPNRQEHGTTHTTPKDAPFTNDWYRNISIKDFSSILTPIMFTNYYLGYYRNMNDLCFYGIKA